MRRRRSIPCTSTAFCRGNSSGKFTIIVPANPRARNMADDKLEDAVNSARKNARNTGLNSLRSLCSIEADFAQSA
jgi:hypothetical protein